PQRPGRDVRHRQPAASVVRRRGVRRALRDPSTLVASAKPDIDPQSLCATHVMARGPCNQYGAANQGYLCERCSGPLASGAWKDRQLLTQERAGDLVRGNPVPFRGLDTFQTRTSHGVSARLALPGVLPLHTRNSVSVGTPYTQQMLGPYIVAFPEAPVRRISSASFARAECKGLTWW